ncbi:hypothetical protein [Aeromonas caviae]|uniref:hypothetical protein n=1 Tax=Aeromonas caviae TaxID=648 RepID=UPI0005B445A0|nr:hypothetical protein [Aeromonas caviae]TNH67872.1 hypothetical protein CF142_17960 [Aeromonas caviae]
MASLTLPLPLGGLKGDQYRAHLWLGCSIRNLGEGIVLNFEGVGQQSRVQIQFDDVGAKWLVTAYARLEAL